MRSVSWLLVTLVSLSAGAQSLTMHVNGQSRVDYNGTGCNNQINIDWAASTVGIACDNLVIWITGGTCGGAPDAGDLTLATIDRSTWPNGSDTIRPPISVNQLPVFSTADGGTACEGSRIDSTNRVCGSFKFSRNLSCSLTLETYIPPTQSQPIIHFKSTPPDSPTITDVGSSDEALIVHVSVSSDTSTFRLQYRPDGSSDWVVSGSFAATSGTGTGRATGLQNGVRYEVQAIATDSAQNDSLPSASVFATPYKTEGFFAAYQRAGGSETGGCSSVGSKMSVVLLGLALLGAAGSRRWR